MVCKQKFVRMNYIASHGIEIYEWKRSRMKKQHVSAGC